MKVEPLTEKEKAWIRRAQKVLNSAPSRFEYIATGDPMLTLIDRETSKDVELCDGGAERADVVLGYLKLNGNVHATTG